MSVTLHIWVSIHHLIMFFVAQVQNDDISRYFFHFFKSLVFWVVKGGGGGVKGKKRPKVRKKIRTLYLRNCTSYGCGFCYLCVNWYLQQLFFIFQNSDFWVFQSSLINAKRKFWGVLHLLHMCVIFLTEQRLFLQTRYSLVKNIKKFFFKELA